MNKSLIGRKNRVVQLRHLLPRAAMALLTAMTFALGITGIGQAAGLSVSDLNNGVTASDLANALVGSGVTISNVTFTGNARAAGKFSGGLTIVGFDSGIVLGSGAVQTVAGDVPCSQGVEGPNTCNELLQSANITDFGAPGDSDLTTLSGFDTFDAVILEFDFVPQFSTVQFKYVFSSEEYGDYSNTAFNDVFAFFINGVNCALVPGTSEPVSVDTINNGNDAGGDPTPHHPELFLDNVNPAPTIDTQMDGLTVILTCNATVNANQTNHMKLAMADASDPILDSAVFIKATSLVSGVEIETSLTGGDQSGPSILVSPGTAVTDSATLEGGNAGSAGGTVSYAVFSDADCKTQVASAGTKNVTNGQVPDSDPVTFNQTGIFYWQASYSGDALNNSAVSECGDETVTVTSTGDVLTALSPAKIFVGLANSDDVGLYFDLQAEVLVNGEVVGSGKVDRVWGGSSGFNNAVKSTIPLILPEPVAFPPESKLSIRVSVRQACTAPQERHCVNANACRARLWYNDKQANSSFDATIDDVNDGNSADYFLLANSLLGNAAGAGPKKTSDIGAGKRCSPFKPFGTWTVGID